MITLEEAKEILRVDGNDNDAIIQAICDSLPSIVEIQTGMTEAKQANNQVVHQLYGFFLRKFYYADQADDMKLNRTIDSLLKIVTIMAMEGGTSLIYKVITENGIYKAVAEDVDGYSVVEVEIPEPVILDKTITANGTYDAETEQADGYKVITVDVPAPKLITKMVTENGVYEPADDGADGYSDIAVNVAAKVAHKAVTLNGTYYAKDEGLEGFSSVDVDVLDKILIPRVIVSNGTYNAIADGVDGFSSVTVDVPNMAEWKARYVDYFDGTRAYIPEGITKFRPYQFSGVGGELTIPETVTAIDNNALSNSLITGALYIPDSVMTIGQYAFAYSGSITSVRLSENITVISNSLFSMCRSLAGYVDVPAKVEVLEYSCFQYCSALSGIVLRRTEGVVTLRSTTCFSSSSIANKTGYIYVPDELVESYKTATNWTTYADQIRPLSEYGE